MNIHIFQEDFMKKIPVLLLFIFFFSAGVGEAQSNTIWGKWKTIDDKTKEPKSIVEIYEQEGKLYGKIVKLFRKPGEDQDPVCDKCTGEQKDKKILGMVIINGLTQKGDAWSKGQVLDPDNGKTYNAKIWLEDGKLRIRGYILFLYRTQTWIRYTE
jgi:uncharacterized protein (DUF2147 family)